MTAVQETAWNLGSLGTSHPDEAALVTAIRAGDPEASALLVRTHGERLLTVARRFLRNEQDCADAVQDAFISAFGAIDRFSGESRLGTWLHRIVVNTCLMKLRSRAYRTERSIDELLPGFDDAGHHAGQVRRFADDAFASLATEETRSQVRTCIDQLPDAYRTVLLMRDIEELNTETTARLLGCTVSSVKTRLHRARQALRTLLAPLFENPMRPETALCP